MDANILWDGVGFNHEALDFAPIKGRFHGKFISIRVNSCPFAVLLSLA